MTTVFQRWILLALATQVMTSTCADCTAAESVDELGGARGQYASLDAAPDHLTTYKDGKTLRVTGGSAAPFYTFDQGKVRLTGKEGSTATFSGRSTGWGCMYTVYGVYEGGFGEFAPERLIARWENRFEDADEPRIVLIVNEPGPSDDIVLLGENGGELRLSIFGFPGAVDVSLSVAPQGKLASFPESVMVSYGSATSVVLNGQAGGQVTITATATINNEEVSASINARIVGYRPSINPEDDFAQRSHQKLGVGETGTLGVDPAPGTDIGELTLTWTIAAGNGLSLANVHETNGTADFTAGNVAGEATIVLADSLGNEFSTTVHVIEPTAVVQEMFRHGKQSGAGIAHQMRAYMDLFSYLRPADVSFWKIQVIEDECPAIGTGSQLNATNNPDDDHARWNHWVDVGKGDSSKGCLVLGPGIVSSDPIKYYDQAGLLIDTNYVEPGALMWNIPWLYKIGNIQDRQFATATQIFTFLGDRVRVFKQGVQVEKGPPW